MSKTTTEQLETRIEILERHVEALEFRQEYANSWFNNIFERLQLLEGATEISRRKPSPSRTHAIVVDPDHAPAAVRCRSDTEG